MLVEKGQPNTETLEPRAFNKEIQQRLEKIYDCSYSSSIVLPVNNITSGGSYGVQPCKTWSYIPQKKTHLSTTDFLLDSNCMSLKLHVFNSP